MEGTSFIGWHKYWLSSAGIRGLLLTYWGQIIEAMNLFVQIIDCLREALYFHFTREVKGVHWNSCDWYLSDCIVDEQHAVKITSVLVPRKKAPFKSQCHCNWSLSTSMVLSTTLPFTTGIFLPVPDKGWTHALVSNRIFFPQAKRIWSPWIHDWIFPGSACTGGDWTKHPALAWSRATGCRCYFPLLTSVHWFYSHVLHVLSYHTENASCWTVCNPMSSAITLVLHL